jgi:hypothetical protein
MLQLKIKTQQRGKAMTTTTKTATKTPEWKWNNNLGRDALKLPTKGYYVDDRGNIWKDNGDSIGNVTPLPNSVRVTKLEWVVTQEEKKEIITCQKLTGSHKKTATPARRKESPDGMRGGRSQWGETPSPKAHFVADEYEVTVTYTALVAVNQFGEAVEGKPKFPSATTIAYETGYGKTTAYFVTDLASLDLPSEKTEKVCVDQRENFYGEAIKIVKEYLDNLDKPADGLLKVGDSVIHPVYGQGIVTKAFGTKNPTYQSVCADFPCGNKMVGKCDLI